MKHFELRDPVHKRITFTEFERGVIDHPFFQRLRFISQLGFLQSYVYPGGVHDRFSHSLGAMHVAGRLFRRFVSSSDLLREELSEEERSSLYKRVRLAGLLHDIGHGPFSHASEAVFPNVSELPLNWDWWHEKPDRQATHEDYSVLLIQTLSEEGVLEEEFAQDISSLIHKGVKPSQYFYNLVQRIHSLQRVLKAMISGEVDCDRMDYLLRDSYFCGVAYGQYDIDWLISSMGVAQQDEKLIFTISENGVRAFEDLLLARYHMIDQVYFHKTKAGFTHYLEQAIKEKEIPLEIPTDPHAYAKLRDGAVIELMFQAAEDESNYWSHRLVNRIPAKRIMRFEHEKPSEMAELDRLMAFCDDNDIKHFTHSVANELTHLGEGSDVATMIYVKKKQIHDVEFVPIFEYSDLLRNYNEKIRFTDFFVHREDVEKFEKVRKEFSMV